MSALHAITTNVDEGTMALVDRVARQRGLSSDVFAAEAIRRVAETEADFDAFMQKDVEALDRGETAPHAAVKAELKAMIEKHRQRCA
jgi:hypothetical protein